MTNPELTRREAVIEANIDQVLLDVAQEIDDALHRDGRTALLWAAMSYYQTAMRLFRERGHKGETIAKLDVLNLLIEATQQHDGIETRPDDVIAHILRQHAVRAMIEERCVS